MKFRSLLIASARIALPVFGVLFVLLLVLFLASFDSIGQYALKTASDTIPGRLKVKSFSPSFSGVTLDGVRWDLGDKEAFLEAEQVKLDVDYASLLRRDWLTLIRHVQMTKPGLRVVVAANGEVNLTRLLKASEETSGLKIEDLRMVVDFVDGWIVYSDRRGAGFLYEVSDWQGRLAFPDGERLRMRTSGRPARDKAALVQVSGEVALGDPAVSMDVTMQQLDLLPFAGFPGFGPGLTLISGKVSGSTVIQSSADSWNDVLASLFLIGQLELTDGLLKTPWMPTTLQHLDGHVKLLGDQVSTEDFRGTVADIPFHLDGRAELGSDGVVGARLRLDRFSLDQITPFLENPPDIKGTVEVDLSVEGTIADPSVSGSAKAYDLRFQDQTLRTAESQFLLTRQFVHLYEIVAQSVVGTVRGEGWIFLGDKPRILFALESQDAKPNALMENLADDANFQVRVIGSLDDPMLFGQGDVSGLGSWAQGASRAQGHFVLNRRDLFLIDGLAFKGSSTVNVPIAAVNLASRQVDGIVSTRGFSLADVPGLEGLSGQVAGSAVVSADLSGESPVIEAQGHLTQGSFAFGGYEASQARGSFYFDGYQMVIPRGEASYQGSPVRLSGIYDLRDQAVDFAASSDSLDLSAFGLPGERAAVSGTLSGKLDGTLGVRGFANSGQAQAALSGFRRADGTLGGVAWIDGSIPGQSGSEVTGTVVADGTLDRLNLEYNGRVDGPQLAEFGPLDVYGGASLQERILTVRPTLVTARDDSGGSSRLPFVTYSGSAYPFFGPLLAGPLEKVIVEEDGFPTARSLSLAGQANLADQSLDLKFTLRSAGLERLADLPLGESSAASINESLPFDIVSGYGSVRGAVRGTMSRPRLQADYSLPWLLLANGYENRQSLSSQGRIDFSERVLRIPAAAVSERPFDARLGDRSAGLYETASHKSGLLAAKGSIEGNGRFDLRLATAGFDIGFLKLMTPESYRASIPFGRLASENLHFWGTAANPALAGTIRLLQGGVLVAGQVFPFQKVNLAFRSQDGEIRLEDFVLQATGFDIHGFAKLARGGELSGEFLVKDIDLREFHRFGGPISGISGQANAIAQLRGKFPRRPVVELGVVGRDLTWNPEAIGGLNSLVSIEEFALGEFSPDGESLVAGLTVSYGEQGLALEVPPNGFRFRTQPGGLSLEAEGAVRFPGGVPDLGMFKTFADWGHFFVSPQGPDFGRGEQPFRARTEGLTFAELSRLLGRAGVPYRAAGSAALALQGQWWRDHGKDAAKSLPAYSLDVDSLKFEADNTVLTSGFELFNPTHLSYQREGDIGFLTLEDFGLDFFSQPIVAADSSSIADSPAADVPVFRQGTLQAEGRLALTQLPGAQPESNFHLGAVDIPLENIDFLLPERIPIAGLLESFEINMLGLLPTPRLTAVGLMTNLSLGPLREMTLQGMITAQEDESGGYKIVLGDGDQDSVAITFGDTKAAEHRIEAHGNATLLWERREEMDPTRLNLVSQGLAVSSDSPIDLAAQVVDRNMRILADVVPGKETASGVFAANLNVDGTLGYPQFEGRATLENGQFRSERYGSFENLNLDAGVERIRREEAEPSEYLEATDSGLVTRLELKELQGTLGKKPFLGGGKMEFAGISPTYIDMFFNGAELPIRLPDLFTGTANIDLQLRGGLREDITGSSLVPVLTGSVVIPNGDFDLPTSSVQPGAPPVALALPLDYDLSLGLGEEFFLHAFGSTVRAVGELRVLSEDGEPKVYGNVDLTRGLVRIPFYDASFRIRQGVAHFNGPFIPRLEAVEAIADLGGYRIMARVEGVYPDALKVDLYSDPPLPQSELSRMVVLGGLPGQYSGAGNAGPNGNNNLLSGLPGQGVSFLSGMLTNRLTEQIGRVFSLSEISFDYIPPASYVIKLAKALDPNDTFLLTLTRVIRDNGDTENLYGIEWRFAENLLTRLAIDEFQQLRFWFQSINRF